MSKYVVGDILVLPKTNSVIVILGGHIFQDGSLAYRLRDCTPQYDMDNGEELWCLKDTYLGEKYVDENYLLLWRTQGC